LFILATAIYCALHPDRPIVDYKGREVVTALVEREIACLMQRDFARLTGSEKPDTSDDSE